MAERLAELTTAEDRFTLAVWRALRDGGAALTDREVEEIGAASGLAAEGLPQRLAGAAERDAEGRLAGLGAGDGEPERGAAGLGDLVRVRWRGDRLLRDGRLGEGAQSAREPSGGAERGDARLAVPPGVVTGSVGEAPYDAEGARGVAVRYHGEADGSAMNLAMDRNETRVRFRLMPGHATWIDMSGWDFRAE